MSVDSDPAGASDGPTASDDPAASDAPAASTGPATSDSKTIEDDTPIRRPASPEQWEAVGRKALGVLLQERREAVDRAVAELVATLDYGTPVDATHLQLLRDAIADLETVAEDDLTDLVDEAVPYEQTAERIPFDRLSDALELDPEEAESLAEDG